MTAGTRRSTSSPTAGRAIAWATANRLTVPTSAYQERGLLLAAARRYVIKDPLTGEPFANNKIPSDRISPAAKAFQDLVYPDPNMPGQGALGHGPTTLCRSGRDSSTADVYSVRVDQKITEKNTSSRAWA